VANLVSQDVAAHNCRRLLYRECSRLDPVGEQPYVQTRGGEGLSDCEHVLLQPCGGVSNKFKSDFGAGAAGCIGLSAFARSLRILDQTRLRIRRVTFYPDDIDPSLTQVAFRLGKGPDAKIPSESGIVIEGHAEFHPVWRIDQECGKE
jgi:hypothetical protein